MFKYIHIDIEILGIVFSYNYVGTPNANLFKTIVLLSFILLRYNREFRNWIIYTGHSTVWTMDIFFNLLVIICELCSFFGNSIRMRLQK